MYFTDDNTDNNQTNTLPATTLEHSDEDPIAETKMQRNWNLWCSLRKWAIIYQIPHWALKDLLELLNTKIEQMLPADPRTLLETPQSVELTNIGLDGRYWHYGLQKCLRGVFPNLAHTKTVSININMDGLPVYDC